MPRSEEHWCIGHNGLNNTSLSISFGLKLLLEKEKKSEFQCYSKEVLDKQPF